VARQRAHRPRHDAVGAGDARDLDAAVIGQVVDQRTARVAVGDVAVEGERLARLARPDDVRAVLDAGPRLERRRAVAVDPRAQRLPLGDLTLAATRVLVERDVEALDPGRAAPP
jgi:hypothetical protein